METELWPNHMQQCARLNIPVVLANGRLSERSARGYARFPKLVAPMLKQINALAVQSEVEAQRFIELGARPEAVTVTGRLNTIYVLPRICPPAGAGVTRAMASQSTANMDCCQHA